MRRITKIFFQSVVSLSFKKIKKLIFVIFSHPFFSVITFYATYKTLAISQKYFPKTNGSNGVANAFRHALWCCLISAYCSKISSPKKAVEFCKKITNLHEELFPNLELERKMDLHNNQIGIQIYFNLLNGVHRQFFEPHFFVQILNVKMQTARKIHKNDEVFPENDLVYI